MGRAAHGTRGPQRCAPRSEGPAPQGAGSAPISPGRAGQRGPRGGGPRRHAGFGDAPPAVSGDSHCAPPSLHPVPLRPLQRLARERLWPGAPRRHPRPSRRAARTLPAPGAGSFSFHVAVRVENSSRHPHVRPRASPPSSGRALAWGPVPSALAAWPPRRPAASSPASSPSAPPARPGLRGATLPVCVCLSPLCLRLGPLTPLSAPALHAPCALPRTRFSPSTPGRLPFSHCTSDCVLLPLGSRPRPSRRPSETFRTSLHLFYDLLR